MRVGGLRNKKKKINSQNYPAKVNSKMKKIRWLRKGKNFEVPFM
jgi:hypothetical protein